MARRVLNALAVMFLAPSGLVERTGAQVLCEQGTVPAPSGGDFAYSVAMGGSTALFGDRFADGVESMTGVVFVYLYDGVRWQQQSTLTAADGAKGDWFGTDVAIDGDVAIVGAISDENARGPKGSAYIFRFDGTSWNEEAKFLAPDPATPPLAPLFGAHVSIDGDVAIVGANQQGEASGSAYVYRYDGATWAEEATLLAPDPEPFERFGSSVVIRDNLAIVSATGDDTGIGLGSVFVFHHDGRSWTLDQTLVPSDAVEGDNAFGADLALSGDRLLIGAMTDDNGNAAGAVYVFEFDGISWVEQEKILASDGHAGDFFGESISLVDDVAVVSARLSDFAGLNSGEAYLYRHDGAVWNETKLVPSVGQPGDQFASQVATNGVVAIAVHAALEAVLVYSTDGMLSDCNRNGIADHCFELESDCNGNDVPDECDLADGVSADVNGNGVPDECECFADLDDSGAVETTDLLLVLADWGEVARGHPADFDGSGAVDTVDLLILLAAWGPC